MGFLIRYGGDYAGTWDPQDYRSEAEVVAVDGSARLPNTAEMEIQRAESPALLAGHDAARNFFSACFMGSEAANERLWIAHVDDRARCIHLGRYGDGDQRSVDLPVRQIISDAVRLGSAGILLAHNHPGGDPTPSPADCRATRTLARAAEAIDVALLDHIIFAARDKCQSMRRMGLL